MGIFSKVGTAAKGVGNGLGTAYNAASFVGGKISDFATPIIDSIKNSGLGKVGADATGAMEKTWGNALHHGQTGGQGGSSTRSAQRGFADQNNPNFSGKNPHKTQGKATPPKRGGIAGS